MASQRSAWSSVSPLLVFSCFCLLVGDMLFGFDTGSFGGILANPGFINQFGKYNTEMGKYAFDSTHTSIMSSIPFIGKFLGCFVAGSAIERYGHRLVFVIFSVISFIGVIMEITVADTGAGSRRFAQFLIGRVIVYISVGLVEVDVAPKLFQLLSVASSSSPCSSSSIATGANKAYSTSTDGIGWKTVTGLQFIFPTLLIAFVFFIPDSPRWLLSKDRESEAVVSLQRLRSKADADQGRCNQEIMAIKESLREQVHKGPWLDLFCGNNLRRAMIVFVFYFFQQTTGQAFTSTYQTVFYKENGYADQAFTYPIITSVLGLLAVIPAMYLVDNLGRRYTLMISYIFQAFWLFMLAGLAGIADKTATEKNAIVASFMLFLLVGPIFIPYSPCWLVSKDRFDEARIVLDKVHGHEDQDFIDREVVQIREQIAPEKTYGAGRPGQGLCSAIHQAFAGVSVIQNFQSIFHKAVGFTGNTALLISVIYGFMGVIGQVISQALIADKWNRTTTLWLGCFVLAVNLAICMVLSAEFSDGSNLAASHSAIAFIFLYSYCYAIFFNSTVWAATSEILPIFLRSKGLGLANFCQGVASIVMSQITPAAMNNISWRYYAVFTSANCSPKIDNIPINPNPNDNIVATTQLPEHTHYSCGRSNFFDFYLYTSFADTNDVNNSAKIAYHLLKPIIVVNPNPATVTITAASPTRTSSLGVEPASSTQPSASLDTALEDTETSTPAPGSGTTVPRAAVLALSILGAVAGISVLATFVFILWRRKQKKASTGSDLIGSGYQAKGKTKASTPIQNKETSQVFQPGFGMFEDTQPILRTT
ncbi:hypothetical protein ACJZ2D_011991 [Fusarium nematophilum]